MSQFQQPGISNPEDKFVPAENNGALLLFFPTQLQTQVKTAHGEADAVAARVVRLNDGRVYDNALIFPTGYQANGRGMYDVTYEYGGRTYVARTAYDPGDRIRVRVDVHPE